MGMEHKHSKGKTLHQLIRPDPSMKRTPDDHRCPDLRMKIAILAIVVVLLQTLLFTNVRESRLVKVSFHRDTFSVELGPEIYTHKEGGGGDGDGDGGGK
ncbi:hypothetical protein M0804_002920 [Polistes exclamans]|nr:hypothetical protein M0804_002920 [Polistes exclamans]